MRWLALLLLISAQAQALEYGCKINLNRLSEVATHVVENYSRDGHSVPDSMIVTNSLRGKFDNTGDSLENIQSATLEGFYRPTEDDFYVLPIPLFGASLSRERNVIYICAHFESGHPEVSHMTIYMMRGYHLDPTSLSTVIGDTFKGPQLNVRPINLSFLTAGAITRKLLPVMRWFSFFRLGVRVMDGIQRLLTNMLGDTFGLGVERVTITDKSLELANGVDLDHPERARIQKIIKFDDLPETKGR